MYGSYILQIVSIRIPLWYQAEGTATTADLVPHKAPLHAASYLIPRDVCKHAALSILLASTKLYLIVIFQEPRLTSHTCDTKPKYARTQIERQTQ